MSFWPSISLFNCLQSVFSSFTSCCVPPAVPLRSIYPPSRSSHSVKMERLFWEKFSGKNDCFSLSFTSGGDPIFCCLRGILCVAPTASRHKKRGVNSPSTISCLVLADTPASVLCSRFPSASYFFTPVYSSTVLDDIVVVVFVLSPTCV